MARSYIIKYEIILSKKKLNEKNPKIAPNEKKLPWC
jgi:hypothetical protein